MDRATVIKREKTRQWKLRNPKRQWAGTAYKAAKKRAAIKELPFDITIDYVYSILTDVCPIYGTEFQWVGNRKTLPTSATLDRIDPVKGYVKGNVVLISSKANNIKSAYKAADLYKVADWLYEIENKGLTNGN
jgi:hypothetical protein